MDNEQPTWSLDNNIQPIIEFTKDEFINAVTKLSPEELDHYLYDEFFGVLPHEFNEAKIATLLMVGNYAAVKRAYPNYNFSDYDKRIFNKYPAVENIDIDDERFIDVYGGIAHKIIISKDPNGYYSYLNDIEDKIK